MKPIIRIFGLLFLLLTMAGCIEQPAFIGISNFKVTQFSPKEIYLNADIEVFNPNTFNLKVRPSNLDLYLNDIYIGKAFLLEKYKMKKNTSTISNVPMRVELEQGVMMKLLGISFSKDVKLRLVGKLKGNVLGIPLWKHIDQTKSIDLETLGIDKILK